MDAIVFASFVQDKSAMYVVEELFNTFIKNFSNTDIYVGINGTPCPEYIEYLDKLRTTLNITYAFVPKSIEVASDTSAYQIALKLLKDSNKTYDLIWFGHTKGICHSTPKIRHDFIENFLSQRVSITNLLSNSTAGTYSLYLAKFIGCERFTNILEDYFEFKRPNFLSYLYLYTFYVIKGSYVHDFVNNCNPLFFETNLRDIYVFERDFPQIAWRQGGYPLYKHWDTTRVVLGGHPEGHYKIDLDNYLG